MSRYIAAIDQGTTSTRCIIFDTHGEPVGDHHLEHAQLYPRPGWIEHDPREIWNNTRAVVAGALDKAGISAGDLAATGVTNQRETTLVWDRRTGEPLANAIVWMDTRTEGIVARFIDRFGAIDAFAKTTGLPFSTYFAAMKLRWLLDNNESVRRAVDRGDALFGTVDSWLVWNLTGGVRRGVHVTDITNASRTMLMELEKGEWNDELCRTFGVPVHMLPEIRPNAEVYGYTSEHSPFGEGIPVAGTIGDQQSAMVGQACLHEGDAKNTYGTGLFVVLNTGHSVKVSRNGLIATVCYKIGDQAAVYALEGSIAIGGALVQWLRDNLGIIETSAEIERLAAAVDDNGGVYFVPAFSGLYAPWWRADARGVIAGMTRYVTKGHIARAALEATAYQTRDVLDAMCADSGERLESLKVDGGMVTNELLMQFQADLLGVPIIRPKIAETTALGAAYLAGLAVGFWRSPDDIITNWSEDKRWLPNADEGESEQRYRMWKKAVTRAFGWAE